MLNCPKRTSALILRCALRTGLMQGLSAASVLAYPVEEAARHPRCRLVSRCVFP